MPLALDRLELFLSLIALVSAGLIKGITGIGYATCAMPLLALAVGVDKAIALVVVPALLSNATVLVSAKSVAPICRRFAALYLAILPGIVAGALLLDFIDKQRAGQGLALMTLAYVGLAVAKPELSLGARYERVLAIPAGFVNGLLTGLTGSQILPLVPFVLALRLDADDQALAINLAVTIASSVLGVALFATGIMTPDLLTLSCGFSVPAVAATWAGGRCRGWFEVGSVRRITLVVLVISAAGLLVRPLFNVTLVAVCGSVITGQPSADIPFTCLAALDAALLHVSSQGTPPS